MPNKSIDWPKTLMLGGAIVWFIGEVKGATDKVKGNTTSEWYGDLPDWLQHFISFLIGAVCAHLWRWKFGKEDAPNLNVQGDVGGDVTVEVHKD